VGLGVLAGFAIAPHCIRSRMRKAPGAVTYAVLGMMLGSLYAIIVGPTTLKAPQHAMTISDFHLLWFVLALP
jgi:putative membrane protein